jgi:hypothetical protein
MIYKAGKFFYQLLAPFARLSQHYYSFYSQKHEQLAQVAIAIGYS